MQNTNVGWTSRKLREVARIQSGGTPSRRVAEYWRNGDIPWVTTAEVKNTIIVESHEKITARGLAESAAKLFPSGTILLALYGQGKTRGQVGLLGFAASTNQACAAISPTNEIDTQFLFQFLQFSYERIRDLSNAGGQKNLTSAIVAEISVPVPPLPAQLKIAVLLRTWDDAIEKTTALRKGKARLYKLLTEALIFDGTSKRETRQSYRLGDVTREITQRNAAAVLGLGSVMGVSNVKGIVPMRSQTIGADLTRYKILPPQGFAYNPMRLNVGSIAMSSLDEDILVSPDYVLFECIDGELDPDYLDHLRRTHWWHHHVNAGGSGSVRVRTYYDELASLRINLPTFTEQHTIARALNTAREEIGLLDASITTLRQQKRGLMQKLLTGQWRVEGEVNP